jgi:hypothetical protein
LEFCDEALLSELKKLPPAFADSNVDWEAKLAVSTPSLLISPPTASGLTASQAPALNNSLIGDKTAQQQSQLMTVPATNGSVVRRRRSPSILRTIVPKTLIDLCMLSIAQHLECFTKIVLPDELTLRLLSILIEGKRLNDNTLLPFLHSNLRGLDLSGCQDVNVKRIAKCCTNLTTLSLRGCLVVNDSGIIELAKSSPALRTLNLSYNKKITDSGVKQIALACRQLIDLDLSWCAKLTDRSLYLLAESCPALRHLNCSNIRFLTGRGIKELTMKCDNLESLTFRGCMKIENLEIRSRNLKVLSLARCDRLSEESLQRICCPSLCVMNLSGCRRLTDKAIGLVSHSFAKLETLDLSYCNIRNKSIISKNLRVLYLTGCPYLETDLFKLIGKECPQLHTIHLGSCNSVNDECLFHLTDGCSKLNNINLSRCLGVTDVGINHIATNCALLNVIDISWCAAVTDAGLDYLWKGCFFIESVKIFGCVNISSNSIYTMTQNLPKAVVHHVTSDRDWCRFEALS